MTTRLKGFLCIWCKHLERSADVLEHQDDFRCTAFPDGIPGYVISNAEDHRFPLPDDEGIRYEPLDPDDPAPVLELFGR